MNARKRPVRWAFHSKRAAYGAYTLPTIESEVFILTLVAYSYRRTNRAVEMADMDQDCGDFCSLSVNGDMYRHMP